MVYENKSQEYKLILKEVAAGSEKAFSILYDLFSLELTNHIFSKVADLQVAEDILHDLFFSLWKNRSQLPHIVSLPAYLYSSCRYLILANYRTQVKKGGKLNMKNLDVFDPEIALAERLYYRYVIDMVDNEIEQLPARCKQVFKLSREDCLTTKEIAIKLGIAESTVQKHITKALSTLRELTKNNLHLF